MKNELPEEYKGKGQVFAAEDGYNYFWPKGTGGYSAAHLRRIADELDESNADWDRQVAEDLARTETVPPITE